MRCVHCRQEMTVTRGNHKYTESGLDNVTLQNVEIRECPSCGEREVVTPNVEALHIAIAREIARRPTAISGAEVRFLRKTLGLSTRDFAFAMGVGVPAVYRWEQGKK